jgi:hypothetical protein
MSIFINNDFFNNYTQFNQGKEARLYLIEDVVYKIYFKQFKYNQSKISFFQSLNLSNFVFPNDVVYTDEKPIGYTMDFVNGKNIHYCDDKKVTSIIEASNTVCNNVKLLSNHKLVPVDLNIDNIIWDNINEQYVFVDTYGYIYSEKLDPETIYKHNIGRINESIICGLISQDWYAEMIAFLIHNRSKFIEQVSKKTKNRNNYLYEVLSILQEETKAETIGQMKAKIKTKRR